MSEKQPVKKRKINRSERKNLLAENMSLFLKQYGRKAQKHKEPNDRSYSRKLQKSVKKMKADQLYNILRGDETE